jgi:hypothetical protein
LGKRLAVSGKIPVILTVLIQTVFAAETLDIRILRVEFEKEDNSLTTGDGTFDFSEKKHSYGLDHSGSRISEEYWQSHIEFAHNYFDKASDGKVSIEAKVYPKEKNTAYKLDKRIIDYNRTSRKKGEKMEAFDSARAADYARFVNDVLEKAKDDIAADPPVPFKKRVILIAHAGSSRLVDGGTKGSRYADTPGDFMDAYIDTAWGEFWRGFEVSEGDTIISVMVTSETNSQDGLNWGINGTITSQIGRELGLPYSYDVVKGFPRLGYFCGMDFAGANAGNGFFPTLPSAWMRMRWEKAHVVKPPNPGKKISVNICAAGASHSDCGGDPQIVKIPINGNEYILLENRQRTYGENGNVSVKMNDGRTIYVHVDSLQSHFLDSARQKYTGVIEQIDMPDAALPASGIAAWHVNDWFVKELELLNYGSVNAWVDDNQRDHQFGIAMIEADGILSLGKEFKNAAGESVFDFGSGSDLIPHSRFNRNKKLDTTILSINPTGYGNTASTFGGFSGIKITAIVPAGAKEQKSFNQFTGDSVITWQALKIPVEIEWVGEYVQPFPKKEWKKWPEQLMELIEEGFANAQKITEDGFFSLDNLKQFKGKSYNTGNGEVLPVYADINNDGSKEAVFLGNNRLYVVDSNGVPLPNFPVLLSNGEPEPFTDFHSKPMAMDITGNGSLEILIPANNGLLLAVSKDGKLLKGEFPVAAGTFVYEDDTQTKFPMLLHKHTYNDSIFLFTKHRDAINAFYLPKAKEFTDAKAQQALPKYEISEFFIYPSPVRDGKAAMRFRTLAPAKKATLEVFDITGFRVFSREVSNIDNGSNQIEGLDFSKLGSDVYSARLSVTFDGGKRKEKWVRFGVAK